VDVPGFVVVREGEPITNVAVGGLPVMERGSGNPMTRDKKLSTTHKIFRESMKMPTGSDID
jgi:hypothetical protein